jgi:hypothetical protein
MFFAQTNTRNQFELYLAFLGEIVENDNKNYKLFFQNILRHTKGLAEGTLSYSDISIEHFDLISILASNHRDYFKSLNIDNLSVENFEQTKLFLEEDMLALAY